LDQYFNADMTNDIRAFAIKQEIEPENKVANTPSSQSENIGHFDKIKGFFKIKSKTQENHA
jgi:hypothetical protein